MEECRKYILALRKCAIEHDSDITPFGSVIVSDLCRDTANLLEKFDQTVIKCKGVNQDGNQSNSNI